MEENMVINDEVLARIAGGTNEEITDLIYVLMVRQKKVFVTYDESHHINLPDMDGLTKYFEERGYTFIPGYGKKQKNVFIGPDGKKYDNSYMLELIDKRKI